MSTPLFIKSAARPSDFPPDAGIEVAVAGRSNSGKSTAINCLAGVRKLARVSKTPGRTQLVNFFEIAPGRRLVDLPGYGFARVPPAMRRRWQTLMATYCTQRRSLAGLLVTIDIRRGIMETDAALLALARERALPVLLLLTKCDKLSRTAAAARARAIAGAAGGAECQPFSGITQEGVAQARRRLDQWLDLG